MLGFLLKKYGAFELSYKNSNEVEHEEGVVTRKGRKGQKTKEIAQIHPLLIKDLLPMTLFLRLDEMNFELPNTMRRLFQFRLMKRLGLIT